MRKNRAGKAKNGLKLYILDDDPNILQALKAYFDARGFTTRIQTDPTVALQELKEDKQDILILDYIMTPICGDEVVSRLRDFDERVSVIMLTGHKELAPPLNTIKELDIQGYCEKSSRFDQLELLVTSCAKNVQHVKTIIRYHDGLESVLASIPKLHQRGTVEELTERVLQELKVLLGTMSTIMYVKPESVLSDSGEVVTMDDIYVARGDLSLPERVIREKVKRVLREIKESDNKAYFIDEDGVLIIPLLGKEEQTLGFMGVKGVSYPDRAMKSFLQVFSEQVSAAYHNILMNQVLDEKNRGLQRLNTKITKTYLETIEAMRLLVDAKDEYTRGHSDRVSYYAVELAKKYTDDAEMIDRVRTAGLMHDIGKIGIGDEILYKPSRLSQEEFNEIKKHPKIGSDILSSMEMFSDVCFIVKCHHERMDGTGYPDGLSGDQIPMESRMISIADAFDAMMSTRHYRSKLEYKDAVAELKRGAGTQFDENLLKLFLEVLESYDNMEKNLSWTYEKHRRVEEIDG